MIDREFAARLIGHLNATHDPVGLLLGTLLALEAHGSKSTPAPITNGDREMLRVAMDGYRTIQTSIEQAAGRGDSLAVNVIHLAMQTEGRGIRAEHIADLIESMSRGRLDLTRIIESGRTVVTERFSISSREADAAWDRFLKLRAANPGEEGERVAFRIAFATLLAESPVNAPSLNLERAS